MRGLRSAWSIVWKSLLFFTTWGLLAAPFALLIGRGLEPSREEVFWLARLFFDGGGLVAILIAAWIMLRFIDRRPFLSLGFAPARMIRDSTLGFAIAAFMALFSLGILWLGGWIEMLDPPRVSVGLLLLAGISMLLNAALQELLCRGYVFQTIRRHASAITAVALTSALFTLLHAGAIQGSFLAASNLFLAGVLLGTAYALTENLWLPIALHFFWNFSIGPLIGLSVSGQELDVGHRFFDIEGPTAWTGGAFGIEASLGVTLATLVGIGLVALARHEPKSQRAAA